MHGKSHNINIKLLVEPVYFQNMLINTFHNIIEKLYNV